MNIIAHFDQHELGYKTDTDKEIDYYRKAARGVVRNKSGQVAVMHFTKPGFYKLPGGGIDEGEEIIDALRRELREEMGYEVTDVRELGIITEDRYFNGMHQTSYCFEATATNYVGPELTESEAAGGMELVWADSIEQAIAYITDARLENTDEPIVGVTMMKLRDATILQAASK